MAVENTSIKDAQDRMKKAEQSLEHELGNIRTGRANASLLDRIKVDYYGTPTPVNQMASITIPEARVIMVTPYDKTALKSLEQAILISDLGINPSNDGTAIRLGIPQLTEERRKELAKDVKAEGERAKVAVRNVRRDAMDDLKKGEKDSTYTEDQLHDLETQMQKVTDVAIKAVDKIVADKEKEVLSE